jgi:soluble lytic murein transglycosylase-like protein
MASFVFIVFAVLSMASEAFAEGWQCWSDAATRYNVPVDLLYAIAMVETGNKSAVISPRNSDGSYDIGLMQINSRHLPRLSRIGITAEDLIASPCLNLHVGAMILADMIRRYGYTWVAIGAYNAGSIQRRAAYAKKVYAMYDRIQRSRIAMASQYERVAN